MKLLFFLFLILTALPFGLTDDKDGEELVLVQALWRHGDRSPIGTFESDPIKEEHWPQGFGELSPIGMRQHVELGKKLRERYITKLRHVSEEYKSQEIYVRSTDLNRTLISAISNMIGFYGRGKPEAHPEGDDWPSWFVPVAVHTREPVDEGCPRYDQIQELLKKTPEYAENVRKYQPHLDFINAKSGLSLNLFNAWYIWDLFFVEKDVYKLKLADWAESNDTLLQAINEMNHVQQQLYQGFGLKPLDGVDFAKESAKIHGGPLLWVFIENMRDKLNCHERRNAVKPEDREQHDKRSPLGTPLCKWINKMRYFAYSAHDVTIASLFSAFGFPKTNFDRDGYPEYSACVTLELWWNQKKGHYHVKVLYWLPGEPEPKEITQAIGGCPKADVCTLEKFIERSKTYQMLPSAQAV